MHIARLFLRTGCGLIVAKTSSFFTGFFVNTHIDPRLFA
jgi:hypothetical protein